MEKQTLNESTHLQQLFDAINSGKTADVDALMNAEAYDVVDDVADDSALDILPPDPGAEDQGGTPTPAPTPAAEQVPGTEAPANPPAEDWRTKLPEDLRGIVEEEFSKLAQQNERLTQYQRSNEGRVSVLQKQINELRAQTYQPVKQPDPVPAPVVEPLEDDETLAEIKENDPVMYRALKAREKALLDATNQALTQARSEFKQHLDSAITPIKMQEQERELEMEASRVFQAVPDIREIVSSQQWDQFKSVVPPGVRALAESNSADDMITAVYLFRQYMGAQQAPQVQAPPVSQPSATAVDATAQRVQEERNRKLQAAGVPTKQPVASKPDDLSEEAQIEAMFQAIRKARAV